MELNWKDRLIITISVVALPIALFIFTTNILSKILAIVAVILWIEAIRTAYKGYKDEKKKPDD